MSTRRPRAGVTPSRREVQEAYEDSERAWLRDFAHYEPEDEQAWERDFRAKYNETERRVT